MIYLFIIIFLAICVWIYDFHDNTNGSNYCYWGICILLICIAGFRYRIGVDTIAYMQVFDYRTPDLATFLTAYQQDDLPFEFASSLLLSIGKTFGNSWYISQFMFALITNLSIFLFASKHTPHRFTFILFYFILLFFDLSFETIRQACAVSFALWGFEFLKKKAYIQYYVLAFIAILFHSVAIILLLIPFMQIRFNLVFAIGISIICLGLSFFFNTFFTNLHMMFEYLNLDYLQNKVTSYTESNALGTESLNIVGRNWKFYAEQLIIYLTPTYLICYLSGSLANTTDTKHMSPFIYIWILSISLQSAIPIMYRITEFVLPIVILIFAEVFVTTLKDKSPLKKVILLYSMLIILCYGSYTKFFRVGNNEQHTLPRIVSYFPYADCFTKETDALREHFYREAGRGR